MEKMREEVGLPTKPFFYTTDQVADLLALDPNYMKANLVHFMGMGGQLSLDRIRSDNIAPPGQDARWRIAEDELIRYLRRRGVRLYRR
jgi:hypothetical protein